MEKTETILQYYQLTNREIPSDLLNAANTTAHFNVLKRKNCLQTFPFQRRDYYKLCLVDGEAILYTSGGEIPIHQYAIMFSNPTIKFGWKSLSKDQNGYVCLFNEFFLNTELKREFRKLYSLFKDCIYPFIFLSKEEYESLSYYFKLMHDEYNSDFAYKVQVVQNILRLIIYAAIKIQTGHCPGKAQLQKKDRLANKFIDMLDSQFPVESPQNPILYKAPNDFAKELHVHVNHLNHSLKSTTGKSTTQIINERITAEAIELLRNSDWNISEIGNSLGFDYPQHFNIFFKKQTGKNPKYFKEQFVVNI